MHGLADQIQNEMFYIMLLMNTYLTLSNRPEWANTEFTRQISRK